jgi:hypothetical protein
MSNGFRGVSGRLWSHVFLSVAASAVFPMGAFAASELDDGFLTVDLARSKVVSELISRWEGELAASQRSSLQKKLTALSSPQLAAAARAVSFDDVLSVVVNSASTAIPGAATAERVSADRAKALGEADRDLLYTPVTPCRLVDTRLVSPPLTNNSRRAFIAFSRGGGFASQGGTSGSCNVPTTGEVRAIAANVTVVGPSREGNITLQPTGAAIASSMVNFTNADPLLATANAGIVPLANGLTSDFDVYLDMGTGGTLHVVIDVTGYFMGPTRAGNGLRVLQTTGSLPNAPITINGSSSNIATAQGATVLGGGYTGTLCQDAGGANYGCENQATGVLSTVGGGFSNRATEFATTVMGGQTNTASGSSSSILGGQRNTALGDNSVIVGGFLNRTTDTAIRSVVVGGQQNEARGDSSFAGGTRAVAAQDGAFVWSDFNANFPFTSITANEFAVRARGGARIVTALDVSGNPLTWANLAAGSGSWTNQSDRNAKTGFSAVKPQEILSKVLALPVSTWQYKAQDKSVRHIGPMSQDFKKAFGVGETDKGITTVDADGVALAAIQGLNQKLVNALKVKDAELAKLNSELAAIKKKLGL